MDREQRIVYMNSQITCALIEALGAISENMQRRSLGHSVAYTSEAFDDIINRYGIHNNAVIEFLGEC